MIDNEQARIIFNVAHRGWIAPQGDGYVAVCSSGRTQSYMEMTADAFRSLLHEGYIARQSKSRVEYVPTKKAIDAFNAWVAAIPSTSEKHWNSRYVEYAVWHGMKPEKMQAVCRALYPGASCMYFIFWSGRAIGAFRKAHPEAFVGDGLANHAAYDKWLRGYVDRTSPLNNQQHAERSVREYGAYSVLLYCERLIFDPLTDFTGPRT